MVSRRTQDIDERPNIVIIIADDLTWRDVGAYGNSDVHTPNIDRLAEEGLLFTRAFTAAPMCSPSRMNLYTGLYPVRSGAYPNHSYVKGGVKSIFHYLRELGYRVGLTGKEHVAPRKAFPYEYLGDMDFGRVRDFVQRNREQPFFLVVASHQPHVPWNKGNPGKYDPKKLKLPPYFVDTPATRRKLAEYYAEIEYLDGEVGRTMQILKGAGEADSTLVLFTTEQGA